MGDENLYSGGWTMDKSYLFRLDNLFQYANIKSIQQDYGAWLRTLNAIYRELKPKIEENCKDKKFLESLGEQKNKVNENYKVYKNTINNIYNHKLNADGTQIPKIESELDKFDEMLHIAINKAKLLMKENENPEFALK